MANRERLVKTFCDLAKIDSPSGEEEQVARELQRRLEALGLSVARDKHGNVIASEPGDAPLMLSAHMDTVEPGRGINPLVDGDRIASDGSTIVGGDCKAGMTAILEALTSLKERGGRRRPVQVVLTRQEETGLVGAQNLDYSLVRAKEAVVFDGEGAVTKVTTGSPTYVYVDFKITGRAAHAGVEPEKGISAIRIAAELVASLPQGRLDPETTFNIGTIAGGSVRNAVPEHAEVTGEFRSRNPQTSERVRRQVLDAVSAIRQRYPEARIQEEIRPGFQGYNVRPDDPLVARVVSVMRGMGKEATLAPSGGGTDANVFALHGVRSVVVGVATTGMHTVREAVSIPDLMDAARFCEALLTEG
jgi:tripeptide aminopeptidase